MESIKTYYNNGNIKSEQTYYENGQIKSDIIYHENGVIKSYKGFFLNGNPSKEFHLNKNRQHHNTAGPAIINYDKNNIILETWLQNGIKHRLDGPAHIEYQHNKISRQEWIQNGRYHRDNAPAVIEYKDDKIVYEKYYQYGQCHNEHGPAVIHNNHEIRDSNYSINPKYARANSLGSNRTRKISEKEYWIFDTKLTEEEFKAFLKYKLENIEKIKNSDIPANVKTLLTHPVKTYYENGKIKSEQYFNKNGELDHSWKGAKPVDEYAVQTYTPEQLKTREWYKDGKRHRKNKPAYLEFHDTAEGLSIFYKCEKWYHDDKLHNENGPAIIERDIDGKVTQIQYYLHDKQYNEEDYEAQLRQQKLKTLNNHPTSGITL